MDKPKHTCIVLVHKPNTINGNFYGADVAAPVFKRIAQKIFTDSPWSNTITNTNKNIYSQEKNYNAYFTKSQNEKNTIPNLKGMSGMDAIALLENKGLRVKIKRVGKVKSQSIGVGMPILKNSSIVLELR